MDCDDFKDKVEELFYSISGKLSCTLKHFYEPYGLTAPQAMILMELQRNGPAKIGNMARSLGMTNSNLSVICRRLERSGFIIRKRDDIDQRVVHIYLTDDCKTLIVELKANITTDYLCVLKRASDEDKATILAGLTKLNELLAHTKS